MYIVVRIYISVMIIVNMYTRFSKEEGRFHQREPQVQRVLQNFLL